MSQVISPNEVIAGRKIKFFLDPGLAYFVSGKWSALNGTVTGEGQFAEIQTTPEMQGSLMDITFEWVDQLGKVSFASKKVQVIGETFKDVSVVIRHGTNVWVRPSISKYEVITSEVRNLAQPYSTRLEVTTTNLAGQSRLSKGSGSVGQYFYQEDRGIVRVNTKTIVTKNGESKEFNNTTFIYCDMNSSSLPANSVESVIPKTAYPLTDKVTASVKINEPNAPDGTPWVYRFAWTVKLGTAVQYQAEGPTLEWQPIIPGKYGIDLMVYATKVNLEFPINESSGVVFQGYSQKVIDITKNTTWTPTVRFVGEKNQCQWGPIDGLHVDAFLSDGDTLISDIGAVAGTVQAIVDGSPVASGGSLLSYQVKDQTIANIGVKRIKFKGQAASVSPLGVIIPNGKYGAVPFESQEYPYTVSKLLEFSRIKFVVNGQSIYDNAHPIDLSAKPNDPMDFTCAVDLQMTGTTVEVNEDLALLATKGRFSLIDYKGDVVVQGAVGETVLNWTTPAENKNLIGKIRWEITDPSLATPLTYENDLRISVYSTLPEVMPELTVTQLPKPVVLHESFSLTATVSSGTVKTIKWNGVTGTSTYNGTASAGLSVDCEVLVTPTTGDDVTLYKTIPIETKGLPWGNVGMTLTAKASQVAYGQNVELTPVVTGLDSRLVPTLMFRWYKDGVEIVSQEPNKLIYQTNNVGMHTYRCEATASSIEHDPQVKTVEATTQVETVTATMVPTLDMSPKPAKVRVQNKVLFGALVQNTPPGALISYSWLLNGVNTVDTESYEFTAEDLGVQKVKVEVRVSNPGFAPVLLTEEHTFEVVDTPIVDDSDVNYIHPLPQRDSAFIWAGWWVMREIEYATENGIDWKEPDNTDLKYKKDLRTIAKMLADYPNVEIQESRNGYIIGRSVIESGKIYN